MLNKYIFFRKKNNVCCQMSIACLSFVNHHFYLGSIDDSLASYESNGLLSRHTIVYKSDGNWVNLVRV